MITTTVLDNNSIVNSFIYYADFKYKLRNSNNEHVCLSNTSDHNYINILLETNSSISLVQNKYVIKIKVLPLPDLCRNLNVSDIEYASIILKSNYFVPLMQIDVHFYEDTFFMIENVNEFKYFINLFINIESYVSGDTNVNVSYQEIFIPYDPKSIEYPSLKTDFNVPISSLNYKKPPYYSDSNQALLSSKRDKVFYVKDKSQDLFMLEDRISTAREVNNSAIISFMSVRNENKYSSYPITNSLRLPILISRDGFMFFNQKSAYRYTSGFLGHHPMYVSVQRSGFSDLCNQSTIEQKSEFLSPNLLLDNFTNANFQNIVYVHYPKIDNSDRFFNFNRVHAISMFAESFELNDNLYSIDYNKVLSIQLNDNNTCIESKISAYFTHLNESQGAYNLTKILDNKTVLINRLIFNPSLYPDNEDFYFVFTNILGTGGGYMITRTRKKITHRNNLYDIYNYTLMFTYRTIYLINYIFSSYNNRKKLRDLNRYYYIHDIYEV
ncbi:MAG: hypothetical protein QXF12_08325 [Candidatus Aenigmatarchaeota archaeon]